MAYSQRLKIAIFIFTLLFFVVLLYIKMELDSKFLTQCGSSNPIVRQRIKVKEPFQNPPGAEANASYVLLSDTLPPKTDGTEDAPTSERCYAADFQTRLERTANFRQMTNNYKRETPDSCSGLQHDLTTTFYKVEPLPAA